MRERWAGLLYLREVARDIAGIELSMEEPGEGGGPELAGACAQRLRGAGVVIGEESFRAEVLHGRGPGLLARTIDVVEKADHEQALAELADEAVGLELSDGRLALRRERDRHAGRFADLHPDRF